MDKRGFVFRFIFSIILGFLPSFFFIYFFVQKGSSYATYRDFLLDLNVSWLFWFLVAILSFFIFIILTILKPRQGHKRNKFLALILIIFILVAIFLVFAQSYLYTGFLLGNDILVRLSADKDNIFFTKEPAEEINFKISVAMNPFCTAKCTYEFFDMSDGKIIDKGSFDLTSISTRNKKYVLDKTGISQSQGIDRFEVSCKSQRTRLCYTREDYNKRSVLITLNYVPTNVQIDEKNNLKQQILSLKTSFYSLNAKLEELNANVLALSNVISIEDFKKQSASMPSAFSQINSSLQIVEELWKIQSFSELEEQMPSLKDKIINLDLEADKLNLSIASNISLYNSLISDLVNYKNNLKTASQMNLSDSSCSELNGVISSFNAVNEEFAIKSSLLEKEALLKNLSTEVKKVYSYTSKSDSLCALSNKISEISSAKMTLLSLNKPFPQISLPEPSPTCCYYGKCEACCDQNCSQKNYPVIFLHGHSLNRALAADYSLDSLAGIKEKLASNGYIDAGAIVISPLTEQKGLWGRVNAPMAVTGSYYFDVYKTESGETTVPSKTDSIDTYAIRLKDLIQIVKYRTSKDKVVIIAHSMGGLVARRYVEVFGGADIDKAILLSIPNHGIDDKTRAYCGLIGPKAACSDMNKDSIFINRLNSVDIRDFPVHNIIGIGCDMGTETGDGIVKNSSQYLDYATNYYVEGSCDESNFEFLHETIINPNKYPETLEIINKILKNETA